MKRILIAAALLFALGEAASAQTIRANETW
jgi:hypothetical protein